MQNELMTTKYDPTSRPNTQFVIQESRHSQSGAVPEAGSTSEQFYATNVAASMIRPPNPSIPEHHSSQFAVSLGKFLELTDLWSNVASSPCSESLQSLINSPFEATPNVVSTPSSIVASI